MAYLSGKLSVEGGSSDFAGDTRQAFDMEAQRSEQRIAQANTGAMRALVKRDTGKLRDDIIAGGFFNGVKLSKTWQGKIYPSSKVSLEPAGYIINKAGTIIDAFENGVTITVKNAQYLAIPEGPAKAIVRRMNQAANRTREGGRFADEGGAVMRVAQALGVERLEARIDQATGRGVLVAAGWSLTRTGLKSTAKGQRADTVLFVLVKAATLKHRIRGRALLTQLKSTAETEYAALVGAQALADQS